MASRYDKRTIYNNGRKIYKDYLKNRGLGYVRQYVSPDLPQITQRAYDNLVINEEIWTMGDRLCKLAGKYYGNSTYWWVIAYFNNKPTDAHFKAGDTVYIPVSLTRALEVIG